MIWSVNPQRGERFWSSNYSGPTKNLEKTCQKMWNKLLRQNNVWTIWLSLYVFISYREEISYQRTISTLTMLINLFIFSCSFVSINLSSVGMTLLVKLNNKKCCLFGGIKFIFPTTEKFANNSILRSLGRLCPKIFLVLFFNFFCL